jgi:hypothetical protein
MCVVLRPFADTSTVLPPPTRVPMQVDTKKSGADSLVTALCMKDKEDWLSLGSSNGSESGTLL